MSDNGFLKLDNAIIDYWMSRLNHSEFKTLLTIYRKTIGWSKQYDRISQTQIAELSGITTRSVRTAITSLEELGLILTTGNSKSSKVFTLNTKKLFDVCLKSEDVLEIEYKLESISNEQENNSHTPEENSYGDADNFLHKRHSEDTNKKQVKETNIPFEVFWDLYDYKKNKSLCITKWQSMTDEERTLTIESLDKYKQSTPDKTYRKYPLNYLENECWNDEHIVIVAGLVNNQNYAHNKKYNSNNAHNNNIFSASHKEFEPVFSAKDYCSTKHTKDDEECNLEALGLSSGKTVDKDDSSNDCTNSSSMLKSNSLDNKSINKINTTEDILSRASQVHWSELKSKGLLKKKVNPDALASNTDADSKVNEFLARYGSKGYCKDIS